jgi:hypothetical protein
MLCNIALHALYMVPKLQKIIEGELVTDFNELFQNSVSDLLGGFPLATLFEVLLRV